MTFGLKVSTWLLQIADYNWYFLAGGHCGHDGMVVGCSTTCTISAYHH
jgi:hypothetical protein